MIRFFSRVCLLFILLGGGFFRIAGTQEIRPFKAVFQPVITQEKTGEGYRTTVRIDVPEGYYLYAHKTGPELSASAAATVTKSPSLEKTDPYFGTVRIYDHEHPAVFTIRQPKVQDRYLLKAQGCQEDVICYPPEQWFLSVAAGGPVDSEMARENAAVVPGVSRPGDKDFLRPRVDPVVAANTNPAATRQLPPARTATNAAPSIPPTVSADRGTSAVGTRLNRTYWLTLPWLILLGIGVSFTACIYPLIPIVTSLVVGRNASRRRGYALIATYVLAMAAAMAVLGAVFGYFRINLQVILQTPLIATVAAVFFALLALSMFDLFSLSAPAFLQGTIDRISRRQSAGSFAGAAVMGALSVLVVSPCATPVLTALLLYTTQTTPFKGALALFCFGFGSGLPLFLFASVLRRFMPRAGNWMIAIKRFFAFLLLAVAVWLFGRILPAPGAWLLWALYALGIAVFLERKTRRESDHGFFARYSCGVALIASIVFALQAMQGWLPMQGGAPNEYQRQPRFETSDDAPTLARVIANSRQKVIVDFTADWCIACRIQEREIWHNPRFADALKNYRLVKVDVSTFTPAHRALFQKLDLVGPPAVLFYHAGSALENPAKTAIGELSADAFASLLQNFASGG